MSKTEHTRHMCVDVAQSKQHSTTTRLSLAPRLANVDINNPKSILSRLLDFRSTSTGWLYTNQFHTKLRQDRSTSTKTTCQKQEAKDPQANQEQSRSSSLSYFETAKSSPGHWKGLKRKAITTLRQSEQIMISTNSPSPPPAPGYNILRAIFKSSRNRLKSTRYKSNLYEQNSRTVQTRIKSCAQR